MPRKWRKKQRKASIDESSGQTGATAKIDHAFASSGERNKKPILNLHTNKKMLIPGLVLIALVGAGGYAYWTTRPEPVTHGPKCSSGVLQRAAARLNMESAEELESLAKEIKQIPGHAEDANCVYVLTMAAIYISDAQEATLQLGQLEKVYNPGVGYDPKIRRGSKSPQELRPMVDFLNKEAARYKNIGPDGAPR